MGLFNFNTDGLTEEQLSFLKYKAMEGLSDNTLYGYSKTFKVFNDEVEFPEDLEEWVSEDFSKDLSEEILNFFYKRRDLKGGYNGYRKRLSTYFNYLIEQGLIEDNPIKLAKIKIKKEGAEPRPAQKENLQLIINAIDQKTYVGFRDYVYILLSIDTGIRPAEVVQVYKGLFNFQDKELKITPSIGKCNKSRVLPVSDYVIKEVKRLFDLSIKYNFKSSNLLLSNSGDKITTTSLQRRLQFYCKLLDFGEEDKITPYMLRHYFATAYLENGGNIVYLQYLMGHADIKMTKKYLKINQEAVSEEHRRYSPVNNILEDRSRINRIVL